MQTETFMDLVRDPAHWEFELFLMLVFDVIIGALLWPLVRKHWQHHIARDQRETEVFSTPVVSPDPFLAIAANLGHDDAYTDLMEDKARIEALANDFINRVDPSPKTAISNVHCPKCYSQGTLRQYVSGAIRCVRCHAWVEKVPVPPLYSGESL